MMWRIAPVLLAAMIGALSRTSAVAAETVLPCSGLEPGPTRTVTRILDGETVTLDDGAELRLAGALAPRAIDVNAAPGAWPPEAATTDALSTLVLGKAVELGFDRQARTDRYGRLQAQAYLIGNGARSWVQGFLVEHGFARAYAPAGGGTSCHAELLATERRARDARQGLWADAAYQIRSAEDPEALLRYRSTFQVVEGRIVRVSATRGTIYLNFSGKWRSGFSASLRRSDGAVLGSYADKPEELEGQTVQVHGWIEQRGGAPVIDLSAAGALEVMREAPLQQGDGAPAP